MSGTRNSNLWGRITIVFVICCCCLPVQAKYGGGTGEPNDPYLIFDANQMNAIGADSNDWDKNFLLCADIDLSAYTGTSFNIIGYYVDWDHKQPFTGVFDGSGHTISNFTYDSNDRDRIGIFGYVTGYAQIRDLKLIDPNIDAGTGRYVGSLVGYLYYGTVTGCYSTGSVAGDDSVGGLVGLNDSIIVNCYFAGSVSGNSKVGGLVGVNEGEISNCYSTGSVSGSSWPVGGLVGRNYYGTISNCYSSASVTGNYSVGGLVGQNGIWRDYEELPGTIYNCYSTGSVSGNSKVGGLVGYNSSSSAISDSFWDIETSGLNNMCGYQEPVGSGCNNANGKTTAQMQDPNTFMDAGWDFVGEFKNGGSDDWAEPVSGGYMILWWQLSPLPPLPTFSGGTGEPNNPYLLSTAADLNRIGHNPRLMGAHFNLINDIDLVGIDFYIIGSAVFHFAGVFDGNGFEISGLTYNSTGFDRIGLFAYVKGADAEIKDLGLIDAEVHAGGIRVGSLVGHLTSGTVSGCYALNCNVSGGSRWVGGLVGQSAGTITNCHATGSTFGTYWQVGGLVGGNQRTISNCYSTGSVEGGRSVGGLVGLNYGGATVTNCYSRNNVSGRAFEGGLVGANVGTITNCHATGSIEGYSNVGGLVGENRGGTVTNCYVTGTVTGTERVGGMVGRNWGITTNCYAAADIQGDQWVGGLVGVNLGYLYIGTISNCYSTGGVIGLLDVGGLVGSNSNNGSVGVITASFWDIETSEKTTSAGGTPKMTAEMQTESTFTDAGWDFITPIWKMNCEGMSYPKLSWWQPVLGDFLCPDGVDFVDYSFFASHWAEDNCGASNDCDGTDLNLLGTVDINDLRIFVDNWLRGF